MKVKRVVAFYFSATNTTEKIVTAIAKGIAVDLDCEFEERPFTLPDERQPTGFNDNDLVVAGVPVYAGRVPNVLLPFLKEMVSGGNALAVPVVLYGNRNYDDALMEWRNILEDDGFHTIAAAAFIGEHAFSKTLAAGRPDVMDMAGASQFANRVAQKVLNLATMPTPVVVPGNDPIGPYYTPRDRKGNPIDIRKVTPKTSDACTHCGLCAKICPMGSIDPEDVSRLTGICIKCCACEKHCPSGAKYFDDPAYLYHKHELEEGYKRRADPEYFF